MYHMPAAFVDRVAETIQGRTIDDQAALLDAPRQRVIFARSLLHLRDKQPPMRGRASRVMTDAFLAAVEATIADSPQAQAKALGVPLTRVRYARSVLRGLGRVARQPTRRSPVAPAVRARILDLSATHMPRQIADMLTLPRRTVITVQQSLRQQGLLPSTRIAPDDPERMTIADACRQLGITADRLPSLSRRRELVVRREQQTPYLLRADVDAYRKRHMEAFSSARES